MFAPVYEEAATLILAREHLVDFVNLNVSEVAFLCEAECLPIVVVLENASYSDGGVGKETGENCDDVCFG